MKTNYHTHTFRCGHARGNEEEYILSAIKNGYEELGFADHTPHIEGGRANMRMRMDSLDQYVNILRELKEKYASQITIYIGLEAEYFEDMVQTYQKWIETKYIDYLIFGNHYPKLRGQYFGFVDDQISLDKYVEHSIKGMESGLFKYFAHPDLFMRTYPEFDIACQSASEKICLKAKELDIPLEYNLGGFRYKKSAPYDQKCYPNDEFFKIAARIGNKVIIGGDFHKPDEIDDTGYEEAQKVLKTLGCNVIDRIII